MSLFRFPGSGTLHHEPFYAIVDAHDNVVVQAAVRAVVDAGVLTVIHLGCMPPQEPAIVARQLLVVAIVECNDETTLSGTPGMIRKLKNRLANHGFDGRLATLSESPTSQRAASDKWLSTMMQTMQSYKLPSGGFLWWMPIGPGVHRPDLTRICGPHSTQSLRKCLGVPHIGVTHIIVDLVMLLKLVSYFAKILHSLATYCHEVS
ncbi:MAG: hypothetical protein GFH27_549327n22 [Chloroflexi bacterium AL-W]|nr:hypothetical protein [Chloroflexi bacterium AL-W]